MFITNYVRYLRNLFEDLLITSPYFGKSPVIRTSKDLFAADIEQLKSQGYCHVKNLLTESELVEIAATLSDLVKRNDGLFWNDSVKYFVFDRPLSIHPALTKITKNPYLLDLVEGYFNRKSYLADADMRRVLPVDMKEMMASQGYSSSNWHRDTRGRQLKLMVYLSDVCVGDSNFSFIPKTHKGKYLRKMSYLESRFSDDQINDSNFEKINWYGSAGDAYLFDTNLIHRLCRNKEARIRDSFTLYFTPGQELRFLDIDKLYMQFVDNEIVSSPKSKIFRARKKYKFN